jgi:hypothetical protein
VVATIPVPIEFSLPEGWRSAPPDEVGAPEAGFVALHPPGSGGFTPNITISGDIHADDVPLTRIADEVVERLRAGAREVTLGRRTESGSAENPGLTQAVKLSVLLDGKPAEIVQFQVFLSLRDTRDPSRRAVLHVVLSALPDQFADLIEDFHQFVRTIRPEEAP